MLPALGGKDKFILFRSRYTDDLAPFQGARLPGFGYVKCPGPLQGGRNGHFFVGYHAQGGDPGVRGICFLRGFTRFSESFENSGVPYIRMLLPVVPVMDKAVSELHVGKHFMVKHRLFSCPGITFRI